MAKFFNNLKMGKKMILAPLAVVFFLIILGYFTVSGLFMQKASLEDIFNNRFKDYQSSAKMLIDISNVQGNLSKILNWVSASHDTTEVAELSKGQLKIMAGDVALARKLLASPGLTPDEKKDLKTALDRLLAYQKAAARVIEMAPSGGATVYLAAAEEKFESLNKALTDLLKLEEQLGQKKYEASLTSFNSTLSVFLGIFVLAVTLSFLISIYLTRMILEPIRRTIHVLREIADGDLTRNIEMDSRDEIGELVRSVNTMREKMGKAVGQALQVSKILAEAASQEAASIEETSASMDEIASMTRQNASNTDEANRLMISAKDAIQTANGSMTELTRSIKEIAVASEQTQKIVKSIDEIAFQTNLLSLNASVEAARAGEAGAGFAVVAEEVRNLALRAAESARNSSILIADIVGKVKNGESLVVTTGKVFSQVTMSSEKVVALMGEIATASQEQSRGIDQVNSAIAGMNTTTQQNALNADRLSSIMSIFKTESKNEDAREAFPLKSSRIIDPEQVLLPKD